MNFGDIEALGLPNVVKGDLLVKDFSNPINLIRLNQVMKDEDIEGLLAYLEWDFLISDGRLKDIARNPIMACSLAIQEEIQKQSSPEIGRCQQSATEVQQTQLQNIHSNSPSN